MRSRPHRCASPQGIVASLHASPSIVATTTHPPINSPFPPTPTPTRLCGLAQATRLLSLVWAGAAAGMLQCLFFAHAPKALAALLYVALGWMALPFVDDFMAVLPGLDVALIVAGGVIYSLGVSWRRCRLLLVQAGGNASCRWCLPAPLQKAPPCAVGRHQEMRAACWSAAAACSSLAHLMNMPWLPAAGARLCSEATRSGAAREPEAVATGPLLPHWASSRCPRHVPCAAAELSPCARGAVCAAPSRPPCNPMLPSPCRCLATTSCSTPLSRWRPCCTLRRCSELSTRPWERPSRRQLLPGRPPAGQQPGRQLPECTCPIKPVHAAAMRDVSRCTFVKLTAACFPKALFASHPALTTATSSASLPTHDVLFLHCFLMERPALLLPHPRSKLRLPPHKNKPAM